MVGQLNAIVRNDLPVDLTGGIAGSLWAAACSLAPAALATVKVLFGEPIYLLQVEP